MTPETGSQSPVIKGGSYAFTVTLPEKYDSTTLVVKAGNTTLTADGNGIYTIPDIQSDTLIDVTAKIKTVTLTGVVAAGSGTVTPASKQVSYDGSATISAVPNTGYKISAFTVDGADVTASLKNNSYTISNIKADVEVSVTFTAKVYTVTKTAGAGGSITAADTVEYGKSLDVTVTPDNGMNVGSVTYTVSGVSKIPALADGADGVKTFTISNVTGDVAISAAFAAVDKTALLSAIAAASQIDPAPYQQEYRDAFSDALADAVTARDNASATDGEVLAATTALNDAMADLTDEHKQTFTVTVTDDGNGSASVSNSSPKYGEDVTINSIQPNANYELYKTLVNGVQTNGTTVRNVTANITIKVMFRSTIPAEVTSFRANYSAILAKSVSTVQAADSDAVNSALSAYTGLTPAQQKYLAAEYQLLTAMRTYLDNKASADTVTNLINALSNDGTMNFVKAAREAKAAYDALTSDQKKLVLLSNVNKLNKFLTEADEIFQNNLAEQAKLDYVNDLVDALKTAVGGADGYADVAAANAAYLPAKANFDALTAEQQAKITNSANLTALASAILTENTRIAGEVETQIDALTVVTSDMAFDEAEGYKAEIVAAKNAYDALTADQKALVDAVSKAHLDECFESVAVKIEKSMPTEVDQSLAGGLSFAGISDSISDLEVGTAASGAEEGFNIAINSGTGAAMQTELLLDLTPRDADGNAQQPEGKVKIRILLGSALSDKSETLSVVAYHNGDTYHPVHGHHRRRADLP